MSESPTAPTAPRPPLNVMQVVGLAALIVFFAVAFDFSRRLSEQQRLTSAAATLGAEVALLETEQAALRTQVAYATTDAAVVEWAYQYGRMVRPGEVLVVPIIPTPASTPTPAPPPTQTPVPNWWLWWQEFFGP